MTGRGQGRVAQLLLWLGAVLLLGPLAMAPARTAPLTLALSNLPYYAPVYIAEAEGYFVDEGLDLRLIQCANGRRCLQHLMDNEAQVATVADLPIVFALHAGRAIDIVATFSASSRNHRFVVRADRGISTPADLKGKRIGFARGTSTHYFTHTVLQYHGLGATQVTLVPLDAPDATEALVRGDVDAAGFYLPRGPQALALLGAKGGLLPNPRLYTATNNLVSQPGVSDADLTRLLRALHRANAFIRAEPERARMLTAKWLKMDRSVLDPLWSELEYRLTLDLSLLNTLEAESRWALREGLVPAGPTPDYLARVRSGPLRTVDPRAVLIAK